MSGASVSEVHAYPSRPPGFEEPLFPTAASRRAVAEHLLEAPWLSRASELEGRCGEVARSSREPVELKCSRGGVLVRRREGCGRRRGGQRVVEVLDRWREVGRWWEEESRVDRSVVRVLLCGGAVVDLALERGDVGGWFLVGVAD